MKVAQEAASEVNRRNSIRFSFTKIEDKDLGPKTKWEKIGEGNFSEVYRTTYGGHDVAVKKYSGIDINIESIHIKNELESLE